MGGGSLIEVMSDSDSSMGGGSLIEVMSDSDSTIIWKLSPLGRR